MIRCAGSWLAEANEPQKDTPEATSGTAIHAVLEGSKDIEDLNKSEKVTAQRIMQMEAEIVEEYDLHGAEVHREIRIPRTNREMEWLWSGQPDVIFVKKPFVYVVNYKTGWYEPIAIDQNWQMVAECALAIEQFNCQYAIGVLLHPNSGYGRQTRFFKRLELDFLVKCCDEAALNALAEEAQKVPGLEQCTYCTYALKCESLDKQIQLHTTIPVDVTKLTPMQRGSRLKIFQLADKLVERQREALKDLMKTDPLCVEGWELAPGVTKRSIEYSPEMRPEFVNDLGKLGVQEHEVSTVSITKVEEVVYDRNQMTQKEVKTKVAKELSRWIRKKTSEQSLKEKKSSAVPKETPSSL